MGEQLELKNRIREIAAELIPANVLEEVLIDVDSIVTSINEKMALILKTFPDSKVNLEGQIKAQLLVLLHSERVVKAAYDRYLIMMNGNGCTYLNFARYAKRNSANALDSIFLHFLALETRGIKPGVQIKIVNKEQIFKVLRISRDCRVKVNNLNNKGFVPLACTVIKEEELV
jgi:hypothetical protein